MPVYERSVELPLRADEAFALHESSGILEALTPPWEKVRVLQAPASLRVGTEVILELKIGPLPLRWVARHTAYDPPRFFEDTQERGPFWKWVHQHRFADVPGADRRCVLTDHVEYELAPRALRLPARLALPFVRRRLERMFAYRHEQTLRLSRAMATGASGA
jgi:ligand-binding SRPBCC domain-containing protein